MRCDIQDMSSVSKRDKMCFFFTILKEEEGFGKNNDHASIPHCFQFSSFCSDYYLHFKQEMLNGGIPSKHKKRDVFYII